METTVKVLETMRSAGKPVSAGEVDFLKRCCSNISTYLYLPVEPTLP